MSRPRHSLAQVIVRYGEDFLQRYPRPAHHLRTLGAIARCRTAAMGGHMDACSTCGTIRISYNSCRNRHCPRCQGTQRERWVMLREAELPARDCFHLVFTLPSELNSLCMHHPKALYDALFAAAWSTVHHFSQDPAHLGAHTGMIAVLHTWGQQLALHPHLHCIIPAGGLTVQGRWKPARGRGRYLFPTPALAQVFRARFMALFTAWSRANGVVLPPAERKALFSKPWVVYAKAPLRGRGRIIAYLGRYTHRTGISDHRLQNIEDGGVSFTWKDYRDGGKVKLLRLDAPEFLRRFCLHILPRGYRRIRHYGILSNRRKRQWLGGGDPASAAVRIKAMDWQEVSRVRLGYDPRSCAHCGNLTMVTLRLLPPYRGPPPWQDPTTRTQHQTHVPA
jgi:hypothetical protein